MHISEKLALSTIRIQCDNSVGTGFFYHTAKKENGDYVPLIITNKHVVEGASWLRLTFTKSNEEGQPIYGSQETILLDDLQDRLIPHPRNDIDLCSIPLAPIMNIYNQKGIFLSHAPIDITCIPTSQQIAELKAIENVTMVGYPQGLWDQKNNMPIFRRGITASNPTLDWNGENKFLIDMACFPGSSGSPVYLYDEGGYTDKKGNTFMGSTRFMLLGILYAGPQFTVNGEIRVVDIPTQAKPISETNIPMNLGYVIKSEMLNDFNSIFANMAA